ncbi:hepatic lectin-like [Mobula hypostoma]|uniref:hepatic lectin-like n=1 Tax=Mobula hypostoma TaxID=723540 RepID=UPI002FC38A29
MHRMKNSVLSKGYQKGSQDGRESPPGKVRKTPRILDDTWCLKFREPQSILASKLPELKINNHFWTPCPKIWATFNQSCYYFSSSSGDWHFAKQKCSMLGSHLLVINNIEEQIFIKKLSVPKMYWIGLSDSAEERHWQWEDGTEYDSTPHFWASGEPNDAFNNEDCAHLDDKGQWNDINCSTKHNWICEKNSV